MTLTGLVNETGEGWIALAPFIVFMAATEIGFRRGQVIRGRLGKASITQLSGLQEAMVGLLALLLAFSFSMAESRYSVRRELVIDEANAIDIANQRSQLLPEPNRSEVGKLLKQYVDARLAYFYAGVNPQRVNEALSRSEQLQKELWSQASAVANENPNPVVALFVSSIGNLTDLATRRVAETENQVPEIVYYLLFTVGIVAMALVGFGCGLGDHRHLGFVVPVIVLICFVIMVTLDFDQPTRGFIRVSQQSMIKLRDSLR